MNVQALRKALESLPDDQLVVLSTGLTDRATPLGEVSEVLYASVSYRHGAVYFTPEDLDAAPEGAVRVLLLESVI